MSKIVEAGMPSSRAPLIGPLPRNGPWTAVALSRGEFLAVLAVAVGLFLVLGGPIWLHLHDPHFVRIAASYAVIPLLVAVAQWRSGTLRAGVFLGATALIAAVKLVLTAGLTVILGIAG
jgi:hypothetical protein